MIVKHKRRHKNVQGLVRCKDGNETLEPTRNLHDQEGGKEVTIVGRRVQVTDLRDPESALSFQSQSKRSFRYFLHSSWAMTRRFGYLGVSFPILFSPARSTLEAVLVT